MDQGLLATPNLRSFWRFTSRALWTPSGSIHGFDLGSIVMINSAYNTQTEKVPYAYNGNNVIAVEEAIMVQPTWKIKGNQFFTRIRQLLLMGTKQADVVQASATGATQTISGVVLGASYDLGVRNLANVVVTVSAVTKTAGVDYEVDPINGIARIIETGTIAAGANAVFTYDVAAVTREEFTAFDNQNQIGTLRCFDIRTGDNTAAEEGIFTGNLYTDNQGDIDPKKHREWTMTLSVNGVPKFRYLKT